MNKYINYIGVMVVVLAFACKENSLPAIAPNVITEKTKNDTDDPAIWVNPKNAEKSIVFGTDKETDGGVYAFDLNGKIIKNKSITGVKRPNNVDVAYNFKINDSTFTDVLVFTEREKQQIRMFSVPDMMPLDNGGFSVFKNEKNLEYTLPMGVGLYTSSVDNTLYAIVSRKNGPKDGYLHQYKLSTDTTGVVQSTLVRKFGVFSGKKEIEAIAVDSELGYVYYSDEQHGIRKYYAEPTKGDKEISCFGGELFLSDIEGIAIAKQAKGKGYIIVSDQQKGQFNIFSRDTNKFVKAVNLSTTETDGCEVVTVPLNNVFKNGLFVAMNDAKDFYFYDLAKLGL
ncbi:phytase [Cellulophaga geojensis]|nr:phytase [Cellulophaga geojensis]